MTELKSIASLKSSARLNLAGHFSNVIKIFIAYLLITNIIISILPVADYRSADAFLISTLLYLCGMILLYVLRAGLYSFFIKLACKKETSTFDLLYFIVIKSNTALLYSVMMNLVLYLCCSPSIVFLILNKYNLHMKYAGYISIGILFIGLVIYYLFYLGYSQVFFILCDYPNRNLKDILMLSRWLMKGQKIRFIRMQLSFIPLLFFGFLSFGIGLLWVMPYMYMTYTSFYLNLVDQKTGA